MENAADQNILRRNEWILCAYWTLAVTSLLVTSSVAYPQGAPKVACMMQLDGHREFRGVMLQARPIGECHEPVGSFVLDPSEDKLQLLNCSQPNDTVTHRDSTIKTSFTVWWLPPPVGAGHVFFQATVVVSKGSFWNNILSTLLYQEVDDPTALNECHPPVNDSEATKLEGPHKDLLDFHDDHSHHDDGDHKADDHSHDDHRKDEHRHSHKPRDDVGSAAGMSGIVAVIMTSFVALLGCRVLWP